MAHADLTDHETARPALEPSTSAVREVRKATEADASAVTNLLARAFEDDPFINWLLRADEKRSEAFLRFFGAILRWALPYDLVYTTTAVTGAALWVPPGKWKFNLLQQLRILPDYIRAFGRKDAFKRLAAAQALEARHPHAPHFYLPVIGVDPAHQGRGIGGSLLQTVLVRCDREGVPAYLEASSEQNLSLYRRNGFEVVEDFKMASDAPPVWLMWREPRTISSRD